MILSIKNKFGLSFSNLNPNMRVEIMMPTVISIKRMMELVGNE